MKIFKTLICASLLMMLAACSGSPAADGEKAAKMQMELPEILTKYGYDSDEYKKAADDASEFAADCMKKYGDDEQATQEFNEAYFQEIKAEMQKNAK